MRAGGKDLGSMAAEICARLNHSIDWPQGRAILISSKLRAGCVCSRERVAVLCSIGWQRRNCKYMHYRGSLNTENITISQPRS